jgi:hypothetical protein
MVYVRDLLRGAKDAKFTAKVKRAGHLNVAGKGEGAWRDRAQMMTVCRAPDLLHAVLACKLLAGSDLTLQDIERILHYMVIESILKEKFEVQQPYGTVIAYMQVTFLSTEAFSVSLTSFPRPDRPERRASGERSED